MGSSYVAIYKFPLANLFNWPLQIFSQDYNLASHAIYSGGVNFIRRLYTERNGFVFIVRYVRGTVAYIHSIIGHYNPLVRIIYLVSHTTFAVFVNFIHKWRDRLFEKRWPIRIMNQHITYESTVSSFTNCRILVGRVLAYWT